jgi:hypothetical protein
MTLLLDLIPLRLIHVPYMANVYLEHLFIDRFGLDFPLV